MTNKTLVNIVSENTSIKLDVVRAVIEEASKVIIRNIIAGETVSIPNVGTFSLRAGLETVSQEIVNGYEDGNLWNKQSTCVL